MTPLSKVQSTIEPLFDGSTQNESVTKFKEHFNERPFLFHHRLTQDPRFEMSSIRALARRTPYKIHVTGDLPIDQGLKLSGPQMLSFEKALDQLEEGNSWIMLAKFQEDPVYRPLLKQCLSEVEQLAHRRLEPLMELCSMSLILSSPGQRTPYHIDKPCNFLFQIHGRKTFFVFNGRDRSVLRESEEEEFWAGDKDAAHYREENQPKAWSFDLKPGNGVHVPVVFPHWVQNGDKVSVSLSINFLFHGRIRGDAYRVNHILRKMGLRPRAVGKSRLVDSLKTLSYVPLRTGIQVLRRFR